MKKRKYLLMLLVFVIAASAQAVNVINNGSFEDGLTNWWTEQTGTASVAIDDTTVYDGDYSLLATSSGGNWAEEARFGQYFEFEASVEGDEITVYFDYYAASGGLIGVNFDYYTDAQHWLGWTEITPVVGAWTTHEITYALPVGTYALDLKVIVTGASEIYFDNFTTDPTIPSPVTLVSPPNNDPMVPLGTPLTWTVDPNVTAIDLYLGLEDDPNLTLYPLQTLMDEPSTTLSYTPNPVLDYSTTYFWKVVGHEPNVLGGPDILTDSAVWSFTTAGPAPVIQSMSPYAQSVAGGVGEDPTITVSGVNFEFFQWYKDGNLLSDGADYTGTTTATLTINDMTLADEGVYSCEVSNSLSEITDIATAVVVTERLMSWWKLDGNLDDSVQEVVAGAPEYDGVVDPNTVFTTDNSGIDGGNSVILDIIDPNCPFITIDGTEEMFNFYEDELTVSAWVRTEYVSSSAWPAILSKTEAQADGYTVALDGEGQVLAQVDGDAARLYTDWLVADGQWHMVTLTYDGATQRVYVDGVLDTTTTGTASVSGISAADNIAPVIIGGWNLGSLDADFDGNIDNIKVYSYALTSTEVGEEYVATNPNVDYVCDFELPALAYDSDGNCRIDMVDFADFADTWLDCNRIPDTACLE